MKDAPPQSADVSQPNPTKLVKPKSLKSNFASPDLRRHQGLQKLLCGLIECLACATNRLLLTVLIIQLCLLSPPNWVRDTVISRS